MTIPIIMHQVDDLAVGRVNGPQKGRQHPGGMVQNAVQPPAFAPSFLLGDADGDRRRHNQGRRHNDVVGVGCVIVLVGCIVQIDWLCHGAVVVCSFRLHADDCGGKESTVVSKACGCVLCAGCWL